MKDRSPRVRASAALALGSITKGSDEALRPIARALKDKYADVRYCAAEALGRIGTYKSRRALERHLRRETHRFSKRESKRG